MSLFFQIHGAGKPLILIPGFASGAWIWFCQTTDLSEDFRVITFDPRGIGRSVGDLKNLSMDTFVEDVRAVLDVLEIERANFLGASFGGFVAQEFALRFPERLDKLILACTTAGGANHIKPDIEILRSYTPDPSLTRSEQIRKFLRPAFTDEFNLGHADEVEKVFRLREENDVAEAVYLAQLETAFTFDCEDRVHAIENKTLVITGDKDSVVPMENSLNLAEKIPNAKLEIVTGGSHLFFIENADEFNRAVRGFLKN